MPDEKPTHCEICGNSLADPPEGQGRHETKKDHCVAHGAIWDLIEKKEKVL